MLIPRMYRTDVTAELPNKGHIGTSHHVYYSGTSDKGLSEKKSTVCF